jgi:hypothetical protein
LWLISEKQVLRNWTSLRQGILRSFVKMSNMSMYHWWNDSNEKTPVFGEKSILVPHCPPHGFPWVWTWVFALGQQWLLEPWNGSQDRVSIWTGFMWLSVGSIVVLSLDVSQGPQTHINCVNFKNLWIPEKSHHW